MEEIEDTNKENNISCSQIGKIDIGEVFILSKAIYKVNATPIKIPMAFSHDFF